MDELASPHSPQDRDEPPVTAMMTDQGTAEDEAGNTPLQTSRNTDNRPVPPHSLLRWIQCAQCSRPLRSPLRLPCGNTLCRSCLPPVQPRVGITYPAGEGRKHGFACPWGALVEGEEEEEGGACVGEHCLGDCGVDVLLTRLVEVFDGIFAELDGDKREEQGEDGGLELAWRDSRDFWSPRKTASLNDGALQGVYQLVKDGRLGYNASQVFYERKGKEQQQGPSPDSSLLRRLQETVRNELDCQVCYSLILDPLTTPCGHTFCRKCVTMVLNHSDLCPVCRRKLNMPSRIQSEPMNKRLSGLMQTLIPHQVAAQREALRQEGAGPSDQRVIPLFVSSVCFPTMPTFLHIFEPRYRIMIRKVMESREQQFGMVAYNRARRRQGGLGRSQFMQYGTLMSVDRFELLPDGRSMVIATGVSRFKVIKSEILDGYHIGRIERLDDIPIIEEERYEAAETAALADVSPTTEEGETIPQRIESMSTQRLFDLAMGFVRKEHRAGAPWLRPRALMAYGNEPSDPSRFPWWLASILNVSTEDKYTLLSTTSVRDRLKITARWVRRLENKDLYVFINPGHALKPHTNAIRSNRPSILSVL